MNTRSTYFISWIPGNAHWESSTAHVSGVLYTGVKGRKQEVRGIESENKTTVQYLGQLEQHLVPRTDNVAVA